MEKLQFTVNINAPKEKVWDVLWNEATYGKWTAPFCEGSYVITDWKEGSKALFLSPKGEGMVSRIEENRPNKFMSIKHLGMVKDGVEDTENEQVKAWAGGLENYTLHEEGDITILTVEMDATDDFKKYMSDTFPPALELVKLLSEKSG
ncbi:MAG: SRPBCC domain-containing protein [Ferruginibacter sp.]